MQIWSQRHDDGATNQFAFAIFAVCFGVKFIEDLLDLVTAVRLRSKMSRSSGDSKHPPFRCTLDNLAAGHCTIGVAGGVALNTNPDPVVVMSMLGMLSESGMVRPLDEQADGTCISEGCGALILELETPQQSCYAVFRGWATNVNAGSAVGKKYLCWGLWCVGKVSLWFRAKPKAWRCSYFFDHCNSGLSHAVQLHNPVHQW